MFFGFWIWFVFWEIAEWRIFDIVISEFGVWLVLWGSTVCYYGKVLVILKGDYGDLSFVCRNFCLGGYFAGCNFCLCIFIWFVELY